MAAEIRSRVVAPVVKAVVDNASRDDLAVNDVVRLEAVPPAAGTTWAWTLVFVPAGSVAVLTPAAATATSGPLEFTVDKVGPYLVRLTVDAGTPTESTEYVRLRALTGSLGLHLVAAGERRDSTGVIPVDVDVEGWANEQNSNFQSLETAAVARSYPYHFPMAAAPAAVAVYNGWVPTTCVLTGVNVFMATVNTQGTFTFTVTNVATAGISLLGGVAFDMNGLVAATVTPTPLKAVGDPDLVFDPALSGGRWNIDLTSDNALFDGSGIYIELIFGVS